MTRGPTYGDVLRNGEFRALFVAHVVSIAGDILSKVAVAVLVYDRTGSPLLTAAATAAGFLPNVVAITTFAAIVDSLPPRRVMILGDCARACCVVPMILPGMPVVMLLVLIFCSGTVAAVFRGARQSVLPDLLGPEGYVVGRSLMSITVQVGQVAGFGFGGLLLLAVTPRTALAIDVATFALSAVVVALGLKSRPAMSVERPNGTVRRTWRGNRVILARPRLRRLLALQWVPVACAMSPGALAAPYAEHLGAGTVAVGLLMGAPACGMVPGDVLVGRFLSSRRRQRLVPWLAVGMCLPLCVLVVDPPLPVVLAALVVAGAASAYTIAADQVYVENLPEGLRGHGMVLAGAGLMLSQGVAIGLIGMAAQIVEPQIAAAVAGLLGCVGGLAALRGRPYLSESAGPASTAPRLRGAGR
ncbi:MFS transporter [Amycolatopsis japonica]|uniref:MFS transporter n=1 Tax=Amycolatopsis japonica TaxID=208439 RepID=UPI0037F943AE